MQVSLRCARGSACSRRSARWGWGRGPPGSLAELRWEVLVDLVGGDALNECFDEEPRANVPWSPERSKGQRSNIIALSA